MTNRRELLAFVLSLICCSADDDPAALPPEQIEADQRTVCELREQCAQRGGGNFSLDDCLTNLDAEASFSEECRQVFAARNECLAEATTCSEYEDAQYELSHRCRDLVVDAEVTFCGPVAEMTDSTQ